MIKKQPVAITAIFTGLVCASLLILAILQPNPRLTRSVADRIHVGMSQEDVLNVVGRPNDNVVRADVNIMCWCEEGYILSVYFDKDGRVRGTVLHEWGPTFLEKLVRRLESLV